MSTQDKTQEKLIASIRKTQQDSGAKSTDDQAAKAKTTAVTRTATKRKPPAAKKVLPQSKPGSYQSVKRVWPD